MLQAPQLGLAALDCGWRQSRAAIAVIAVLASMALVVLDAAMVNVSLLAIAEALRVTPAESVRVVSLYQTAVLLALLPCAAFGERFGGRRVFAAGVALFIAASAVGAGAPSLTWLVAARFLQGLGAAAVMALGVALLRQALPADRMGAAIGWNALTVALCSAAGPAIGALIIALSSWQWLFLVHLPLGLLALIATRALPSAIATGRRLDWASIGLSAAGFASLIFGAEALGTDPALGVALLASSALSISILLRRELPKPSPLIPVDLLRGRGFRLSVMASICCFAGQTAGLLALPFHLLNLEETQFMRGLYMTSWPVAVAIAALISGRLLARLAASWLCSAGSVMLATGLAAAALLSSYESAIPLAACTVLCGFGFGLFQVPNNRTMFLAAPVERSAAAGGMQGTARLMGQTSGAVVMTLLFISAPVTAAPRLALGIGAFFALAAAAISATKPALSVQDPSG